MKKWMKRLGTVLLGAVMTLGMSIPAFADDAHFTFTNGESQYEQPGTSTPKGGTTSSGSGIRNGVPSLVNGVKTGDHSVLLFLVLAIVAALVIGIIICSRKNLLVKRGRTLLSMILVAALAVGGLTTSSALASDDGLEFAETKDVTGVLGEEDPGGTGDADDETQDVTGVVKEDISDGTAGSEEDPQEMAQDLAANPEDGDGEDVESGIQLFATTKDLSDYEPYVQVCVDMVGLDEVGKAFVESATPSTRVLLDGYSFLYYTSDVNVGVYDSNGDCVTVDSGALVSTIPAGEEGKYPYSFLYSASGGSTYTIRYYNGGEMSVQEALDTTDVIRGGCCFYIGNLTNGETVTASEPDSMAQVQFNVRTDNGLADTIGADVILSEGTVMSGSATGGDSTLETNVIHLVNSISAVKESEIYVLMTDASTEVATDAEITFVVERYDAASGTWSPASGVSYLLFDGCTGVTRDDEDGTLVSHDTGNATQLTENEQTTGADGKITVTKTANGYPFIRFTGDEVYANVWEGMEDGTLRIVASAEDTDAAWGWLSGYDGEEQDGDSSISLTNADTFYFGNDEELAFDVEKEMLDGEECDEDFTFYLRNITSASTLPITSTSQILSYEIGAGISYIVYDVETKVVVGSGVTDENGAFTLKPGQYATFSVPEDTTWQVYEGENADYPLYSVEANDDADNPGDWGYADNASIVDKVNGVVQDMAQQNTQPVTATATLILTLTDFEDGTPLAGATFSLYKDGVEILSDLVTDANGQIIVTDCEPGTYYFEETTAPDGGYVIQDEGTSESVTVPEGLTEATVYPVSMKNNIPFYAVKLWGICVDTYSYDEGDTEYTASLTFGPATGDNKNGDNTGYITTYESCDSATCIHKLSWDEIIAYCDEYQGNEEELTKLFGSCLENGCTKSVNLTPNETLFNMTTVENYRKYNKDGTYTGDGVSTLDYLLNGTGGDPTHMITHGAVWNYSTTGHNATNDPATVYSSSRIRVTLTGDSTDAKAWVDEGHTDYCNVDTLCDETNCLFSCFPQNLQNAMVPRKTENSGNATGNSSRQWHDKTTYDKLFLFSVTEMGFGEDTAVMVDGVSYEDSGGTDYGINSAYSDLMGYEFDNEYAVIPGGYGLGTPINEWWSRSRFIGNPTAQVTSVYMTGQLQNLNAYSGMGLSPGFCLK